MEFDKLECPGCGSTDVSFDSKTRKLSCRQCGKETFYSRATLNKHGKVIYAKENAVKFFLEGNFDTALHYTHEVLDIMMDNVPAMYILAYIEEGIQNKQGKIKAFFKAIEELPIDYDEITTLMKLFEASPYILVDFEEDVIRTVSVNQQADEDKKALEEFFDKVCPYFISKRTSMRYLTAELAEMYQDLAGHCNIPKTCYALLTSIQKNPDSPYATNAFFLKTKVKMFYDNYILAIGNIVKAMSSNELRQKFVTVYENLRKKYEQDSGL